MILGKVDEGLVIDSPDLTNRFVRGRQGRMVTLKKWLGRLGYGVFLLLCCELGLQVFYRVTNGAYLFDRAALPIFAGDEHRVWSVRPDLDYTHTTNEFSVRYRTNGQGFRVEEKGEGFAIEKDPSCYRVLMLGPSFAFGWAADYEDSFAARLEEKLESQGFAGGRDVEIINAGVPSIPPANNLNWYKHVGKQYQPDLIIQLVHGSMAVYHRVSDAYRADEDGYLVPAHASRITRLRHIAKNFAVVFYSWTMYSQIKGQIASGNDESGNRSGGNSGDISGGGNDSGGGGAIQGRVVAEAFDADHPMVTEAVAFFDDLKAATDQSGSDLLVVYFPPAYNVHPEDVNRWVHDGVWDIDRQIAFNRGFCDYLNERGVTSLNIDHPLIDKARETQQRLYYWLDTHWTPLGNRVAARAVADYLLLGELNLDR